jgi:hypothetical protein
MMMLSNESIFNRLISSVVRDGLPEDCALAEIAVDAVKLKVTIIIFFICRMLGCCAKNYKSPAVELEGL